MRYITQIWTAYFSQVMSLYDLGTVLCPETSYGNIAQSLEIAIVLTMSLKAVIICILNWARVVCLWMHFDKPVVDRSFNYNLFNVTWSLKTEKHHNTWRKKKDVSSQELNTKAMCVIFVFLKPKVRNKMNEILHVTLVKTIKFIRQQWSSRC